MKKSLLVAAAVLAGVVGLGTAGCCLCGTAKPSTDSYVGRWALDLRKMGYTENHAGWLGIEKGADGKLAATMLWRWASPFACESAVIDDQGRLVLAKTDSWKQDGKTMVRKHVYTVTVRGDKFAATLATTDETGKVVAGDCGAFTGSRIAALPPAPDLSTVKYGKPVDLLAKGLDGWKMMNPKADNGWSFKDGVLMNRVAAKKLHGSNLVSVRHDFEDFNLKLEVNMPKDSNSGVYLRGIYEIQMLDSYGKPVDCHNLGALYGRVTPSVAAEKPADEWQTVDITLVDRHVTVILNGKKILDNAPVLGCTGGAMTADETKPGPIYLQGDHSDVSYRNMVLTPVIK